MSHAPSDLLYPYLFYSYYIISCYLFFFYSIFIYQILKDKKYFIFVSNYAMD